MFVLFHALMLPVDGWALLRLKRNPGGRGLFVSLAVPAVIVFLLAVGGALSQPNSRFFGPRFAFLGILAAGIFVHGTVLLAGAGLLMRGRAKRWSHASFGSLALLLAVAVDAYWIEPQWLEVSHHELTSEKVTRPIRIAVVADIQTDRVGEHERRALELVRAQEPDLILFPGDYIHARSEEAYGREIAELNALLREVGLSAPLGAHAVAGNVDRPGWEEVFTGLDVRTLRETAAVERDGIRVTGLSLGDSFDTDFSLQEAEAFHVAFGHGPDFALGDVRADLLVAGHTHGGQVRIPFLGPPLILSAVPRSWAAGRTELTHGRVLVVSRGIGMERGYAPRIRFFCRPEIVVIDVLPAEGEAAGR